MSSRPDVLAHNVEVVPRLQRKIRDPGCSFERSLETLSEAKALRSTGYTKSSLMLGLGETNEEVRGVLRSLKDVGVDFVTLGQYLRPSATHAPVTRYVEPEEFEDHRLFGEELGFRYVASGPLVRSSYRAAEFFLEQVVRDGPSRPQPS